MLLPLVLVLCCVAEGASKRLAVVNVPVADLRQNAAGRRCCPVTWAHDDEQLTQLLFGEPVVVLRDSQGGWSLVEAVQQPMLYNDTWGGYQGYVLTSQLLSVKSFARPDVSVVVPYATLFRRSCLLNGCLSSDVLHMLSFGVWLTRLDEQWGWTSVQLADGSVGYVRTAEIAPFVDGEATIRQLVVQRSQLLLGSIYSWGGRSTFSMELLEAGKQFTGLDCSGFASILYRSCGVIIPRDASKQAMWVHNVSVSAMQPGDLFFYGLPFGSGDAHVTHVMTLQSIGNGVPLLFESADNSTRTLPVEQVYGARLDKLVWGMKTPNNAMDPGEYLTWGSLFPIKSWTWQPTQ